MTLNELKTEIKTLNNQLTSGVSTQLEKLQATKNLRVLERELLKKDEALFFDKAQIDVDTEKQIAELTNEYNFNVLIGEHFKLQLCSKRNNQSQPEKEVLITDDEHIPFVIKPKW